MAKRRAETARQLAMGQVNIRISISRKSDGQAVKMARESRCGIRSGKGKRHSLAEKLAARITKVPSGCWEVSGQPSNRAGHIHLSQGSPAAGDFHQVYAHVLAWEQEHG